MHIVSTVVLVPQHEVQQRGRNPAYQTYSTVLYFFQTMNQWLILFLDNAATGRCANCTVLNVLFSMSVSKPRGRGRRSSTGKGVTVHIMHSYGTNRYVCISAATIKLNSLFLDVSTRSSNACSLSHLEYVVRFWSLVDHSLENKDGDASNDERRAYGSYRSGDALQSQTQQQQHTNNNNNLRRR